MLITKDQLKQLHKYIKVHDKKVIEDMFPEIHWWIIQFEVGKIYKEVTVLGNGHRFICVKEVHDGHISGYGIDGSGDWFDEGTYSVGNFELADAGEWMDQLDKQVKKKGFLTAGYFTTIDYGDSKIVKIRNADYSVSNNNIYLSTDCKIAPFRDIYYNGVWAKPISCMTIEDAEKKLNIKIIR